MVSETRYMRSDNHTVNGLDANILGISRSDTLETFTKYKDDGSYDVKWGIRVWKRDSGGTETEITSGTPVAQVTRLAADGNVQGLQNATWDCPETALAITDAIVIRVYIKVGTDAWASSSVYGYFITEQLGETRLDSATWTVYYYTNRWSELVPPTITTYGQYLYGKKTNDTWDSRIDNFSHSTPVPPTKPLINKPLVNPILINLPIVRNLQL